jgi:hypothetical protein
MVKKTKEIKKDKGIANCCTGKGSSCGGAFYGLGFIGAAVYYISTATSFGVGAIGVLKALVWPAFVIFELLRFIGA